MVPLLIGWLRGLDTFIYVVLTEQRLHVVMLLLLLSH